MLALITGISGFVGSHLAEYLYDQNIEVIGTTRSNSKLDNLEAIRNKILLISHVDMRDANIVATVIRESQPDYIFHLAAQSFVPDSWSSPSETIRTNVLGTVNVLEAVCMLNINPVIQIAGSCDEYGCPPMVIDNSHTTFAINQTNKLKFKLPITEDFPLLPLSPYGVSKVAQDMLGYQYHKSYGMKIVRTRAFNTSGPRRGEEFVTSNLAKQIIEIEKGKHEPILKVGSLDVKRDFTDVRDVVRGYWNAVTKCKYGDVYNICSGKSRTIQSVLDTLRMQSTAQFEVIRDKDRLRPSDIPILEGDYSKFKKQTGWKPEISFTKTMGDLLDYWRKKT